MARTTLSIDAPILKHIKEICHEEKKTMKRVICELLLNALQNMKEKKNKPIKFQWHSQEMIEKVDIADKDTVYKIIDGDIK